MQVRKALYCLLWASVSVLVRGAPVALTLFYDQNQHQGVLNSLLRGLHAHHIDFNANPGAHETIARTVLVLNNIDYLQKAIKLKKSGKIDRLVVGPNIMNRTHLHGGILSDPAVDLHFVPGLWALISALEDSPQLHGRVVAWPAGIDAEYWKPHTMLTHKSAGKKILVYHKTESADFCKKVEKLLRSYGWDPVRITYGQYKPQEYKDALNQVVCAVFISRSESQGIALAECWAMDIPTLVFNPQEMSWAGKSYRPVNAAPYLCHQTGIFWEDLAELEKIIPHIHTLCQNVSPRQWVLEHMTDYVSVKHLRAHLSI